MEFTTSHQEIPVTITIEQDEDGDVVIYASQGALKADRRGNLMTKMIQAELVRREATSEVHTVTWLETDSKPRVGNRVEHNGNKWEVAVVYPGVIEER